MKILLTHRPGGAYGHISEGWLNALNAAGHEARRWDGQRASWEAFDPDLYIGCSGHRQPIPGDRGKAKVAIHVNPCCGIIIDGINENAGAIRWTLDQKPTVVFGYGHESDRPYWEYWTSKHGIPWVPMPTGGDSTIYTDPGLPRDLDVAYVGGYWQYKARNLDKYLLPLLKTPGLKLGVYGWGDWPVAAGNIEDKDVPVVFARAKVGPCVTEPHTTTWGIDVPERLWKVALCGALVIHDPVKGLDRLMSSAVVASDPGHYVELCKHYVSEANESERHALAQRQRHEVLKSHTYFQRMAKLFTAISEATDCSGSFGNEALKLTLLS